MEHEENRGDPEDPPRGRTLVDALAAADIKRLVRASREDDGDKAEQIRRRYAKK